MADYGDYYGGSTTGWSFGVGYGAPRSGRSNQLRFRDLSNDNHADEPDVPVALSAILHERLSACVHGRRGLGPGTPAQAHDARTTAHHGYDSDFRGGGGGGGGGTGSQRSGNSLRRFVLSHTNSGKQKSLPPPPPPQQQQQPRPYPQHTYRAQRQELGSRQEASSRQQRGGAPRLHVLEKQQQQQQQQTRKQTPPVRETRAATAAAARQPLQKRSAPPPAEIPTVADDEPLELSDDESDHDASAETGIVTSIEC